MRNEVIEILDEAVSNARAAGHEVTGWTMQSSAEGYTAWLYHEDDERQYYLFDDVEVVTNPLAAAKACAARLRVLALVD
ncbi:MAG: hypothetical protein ABMB14_16135 [Myxococcota bacterium]